MILLLVINCGFLSPPFFLSLPALDAWSKVSTIERQPAMQRFFVVLLFSGVVCAILQNFTVDDTSPDITYTNQTFQCNDNNPTNTTCIPTGDYEQFNNSATLTTGSITFSFTGASPKAPLQPSVLISSGTAVYASLDLVGTCSVKVDGNEIATPKRTVSDILADREEGGLSIFKSDLPNGSHTLVIAPTADGAVIGLDHIIYTYVKLRCRALCSCWKSNFEVLMSPGPPKKATWVRL
jgi:hypothetical protein